jgi:hypothetical protein
VPKIDFKDKEFRKLIIERSEEPKGLEEGFAELAKNIKAYEQSNVFTRLFGFTAGAKAEKKLQETFTQDYIHKFNLFGLLMRAGFNANRKEGTVEKMQIETNKANKGVSVGQYKQIPAPPQAGIYSSSALLNRPPVVYDTFLPLDQVSPPLPPPLDPARIQAPPTASNLSLLPPPPIPDRPARLAPALPPRAAQTPAAKHTDRPLPPTHTQQQIVYSTLPTSNVADNSRYQPLAGVLKPGTPTPTEHADGNQLMQDSKAKAILAGRNNIPPQNGF